MGLIDSATNLIGSAKTIISGGSAASVDTVKDAVTGAISGIGAGFASSTLKPVPNPLSNYASYDCIIGLTVLTDNEFKNPDSTYMTGRLKNPMICKSAGVLPNNRVNTPYGKFEFYINNLTIESIIGFSDFKNSTLSTLDFEVFEPYSLFMFPLALQYAAEMAKPGSNWRDVIYLLTIEFRGNKENGTMQNIPGINKYIPIRLSDMSINSTERGTHYTVKAMAANDQAKTKEFMQVKTDVSIKGKTVQELLQTGPQSLQAVVNKRLKALKEQKKVVNDYDEIVILFPEEIASDAAPMSTTGPTEQKSSATASPNASSSDADIHKKLGVAYSDVNKTLVQSEGSCNAIGKASVGLGVNRKGKSPMGKPGDLYDEKTGLFKLDSLQADPKEGTANFAQTQDIQTIINEVIFASSFVNETLEATKIDSRGMRDWWAIDTQVYYKSSTANIKKTGTASRIIVYRIIPYKARASMLASAQTKMKGFDVSANTVVKKYDYIYTGKNTEVIKFDIDFSFSFSNILAADAGMSNIDDKRSAETSQQLGKKVETSGVAEGNSLEKNAIPTQNKNLITKFPTDNQGGLGQDTPYTRIARAFHNALTKNSDMISLEMEIMGDPFWIPQSGLGNYTSGKGPRPGMTKDGSVDYQRTQIDIFVNFRTPIDINQTSGLYNFGASAKTGPVVEFSGLYYVTNVTSVFNGGRFTQTLKGFRHQGYERTKTDTPDKSVNTSQPDVKLVPADNTPATTENTNATMAGELNGRENPEGV